MNFKLFRIDYFSAGGPFQAADSLRIGCVLGCDVEWLIFGYTDEDNWIELNEIGINTYGKHYFHPYEKESCDHAGNRKYAIARTYKED